MFVAFWVLFTILAIMFGWMVMKTGYKINNPDEKECTIMDIIEHTFDDFGPLMFVLFLVCIPFVNIIIFVVEIVILLMMKATNKKIKL